MNAELDNRMVINGGSNGPDWEYNDDADEPEEARDFEAELQRMGRKAHGLQLKVDDLQRSIRDFLHALDRGYLGPITRADLSDSAFVEALRMLAA